MKGGISFLLIILGILGGLTLGLVIGWVLWPVEWVDASPENLRFEWQVDWLNMAIDSYSINQNAGLAAQRYDALGPDAPVALQVIEMNPTWVTSEQVEAYTAAINEAPATGMVTTPAPPSTSIQKLFRPPVLNYLFVVLCLMGVALILLIILVMRLIPRSKVETAPPAPVEPAGPETGETVDENAPVVEAAVVQSAGQEQAEGGSGLGALAGAAAVGAVVAAAAGSDSETSEEVAPEPVQAGVEPVEGALAAGAAAAGIEWALEEDEETPVVETTEDVVREPVDQEWQAEDTVETMPTDFYGKYNRKIIEVEGIGEAYSARLEEVGITTTHQYLQACATTKGREELAAQTGISNKLILEWANHIDLMRIQGIGPQWSDLLEMAGVNTVLELARRNSTNLHQKILEINAEKELVRQLPTLDQVEDWIEQAKDLPRILTY